MRTLFYCILTIVIVGIGFSFAIKHKLASPQPVWHEENIVVHQDLQASGNSAVSANKMFWIDVSLSPKNPIIGESAIMEVMIQRISKAFGMNSREWAPKGFRVTLNIFSPDFDVAPPTVEIDLVEGEKAMFVVSPKRTGALKIIVNGSVDVIRIERRPGVYSDGPQNSKAILDVVLPVTVTDKPTFLGATAKTWSAIQILLASIGVPGLIVLVTKELIDRRKKSIEEDKPRIIIP